MNRTSKTVTRIVLAIWGCVALFLNGQAHAELPSAKLLAPAPLVTPASAWSYYNSLGTAATSHTNGVAAWSQTPAEIVELARSLGAGRYAANAYAASVYEYVRNNIDIEFRFGLAKGARGALIDQSGTAFDQAHLMVELLRQGGVSANYVVGTLSLSAAQAQAWTGFADPNTGAINAAAFCQFLADGGIPATVNGAASCSGLSGNLSAAGTSVVMGHIWVSVNGVVYDPSYKVHVIKSVANLDAVLAGAMGCTSLTNCGSIVLNKVPTPFVQNGVKTVQGSQSIADNIHGALNSYAVSLQQRYIESSNATNYLTNPNMQVEDLIGGALIDTSQATPAVGASPFSALPATAYSSAVYTWTVNVPDAFRTTLRVQIDNIDQTVYADEIAGKRLKVWGYADNRTFDDATRILSLYADYRPLAKSALAHATGAPALLTTSVNHPYAANGGQYADEVVTSYENIQTNVCQFTGCSDSNAWFIAVTNIVASFGNTNSSVIQHYARLADHDNTDILAENPNDPNHTWTCGSLDATTVPTIPVSSLGGFGLPVGQGIISPDSDCFQQQLPIVASTWLAQYTRMAALSGQINGVLVQTHHALGLTLSGTKATRGAISVGVQPTLSVTSKVGSSTDRQAAFASVAVAANRIEGAVIEQVAGERPGASSVTNMAQFNASGSQFIEVNAANVNTALSMLNNYSNPAVIALIRQYVQLGYSVVMSREGATQSRCSPRNCLISTAFGYVASTPTRAAYMTKFGDKGAGGVGAAVDAAQAVKNTLEDLGRSSAKRRDSYTVDSASGRLTSRPPPDLVTGVGEFPYSLSFQRVYSADSTKGTIINLANNLNDLALKNTGWKHTFAMQAKFGSNGLAALGDRSAREAANSVATLYVLRALTINAWDIRAEMAKVLTAEDFGNSIWRNQVSVDMPPASHSFIRLPDGSFSAEPGSSARLVQSGQATLQGFSDTGSEDLNIGGISFSLTQPDGSVLSFNPQKLNSSVIPTEDYFVPTSWRFPSGVVVSFSYNVTDESVGGTGTLAAVSNNLGRKLSFSYGSSQLLPVDGFSVTDENNRTVSITVVRIPPRSYQQIPQLQRNPNVVDMAYPYSVKVERPDTTIDTYYYTTYLDAPANATAQFSRLRDWVTPTGGTPFMKVSYDALMRVKSVTDNAAVAATTTYFPSSLFGSENQKRGEVVDALGGVTTTYFDKDSQPISITDALGRTSYLSYDSAHRLSKKVYPELNAELYTYDLRSNPLTKTLVAKPGSGLANIVSETNSYLEGPTVTSCANANTCNRVKTTMDGKGNVTKYDYFTDTGLPRSRTGPGVTVSGTAASATTSYCYRIYPSSDPSGIHLLGGKFDKVDSTKTRMTLYVYDANNHYVPSIRVVDSKALVATSNIGECISAFAANPDALDLYTTFTFDSVGNVLSMADPRGNTAAYTTNYSFDTMRRLTRVVAPPVTVNGSAVRPITRYTYDADGLLRTTRRSLVAAPTDATPANPWPTDLVASDWQTEARDYYPTGDLKSVTDAEGNATTYAYDKLGRTVIVTDPDGRRTGTAYNAAGQPRCIYKGWDSIVAPTEADCLNWTPTMYTDGSKRLRYAYYSYAPGGQQYESDYNGQVAFIVDANRNRTEQWYDGFDRLAFTFFLDPVAGTTCTLAKPITASTAPTCGGLQTYERSTATTTMAIA